MNKNKKRNKVLICQKKRRRNKVLKSVTIVTSADVMQEYFPSGSNFYWVGLFLISRFRILKLLKEEARKC